MAQPRKYTVVATEPTPNPAALKFNVNGVIIASGSKAYNDEFEAEGDPFAEAMFSYGIVDFLYIQDRFVSVTLTSGDEWDLLIDPIIKTIEEELIPYDSSSEDAENKTSVLDDLDLKDFPNFSDELKAEVIDAYMDETVRPALARDGGGLIVEEVSNDVVHIKYQGACGSCSKSQSGTLVAIQGILQKNISPELQVIVT